MFTYRCEPPIIIQIALKGLPGGGKCRKKSLSVSALPLHVVYELLKKALMQVGMPINYSHVNVS
jgi:hypothetical protein